MKKVLRVSLTLASILAIASCSNRKPINVETTTNQTTTIETTSNTTTVNPTTTETKTTTPVETTTAPIETTTGPIETTTGPVETTTAPVETTTGPVETTTIPIETTTNPIETTTLTPTTTIDKTGTVYLDIIEINDLHGYVNQASKTSGYDLANINYYVDQKRKENDTEVLLVANGDMFEGTAFSNMSQGLSTLNVMNEMNFDMMGIGNHEFSWGLDTILKYFDENLDNGESNFPLINGNIYTDSKRYGEEDLTDNILPYTIVEKGDLKIGLLSYIGDVASSISKTYRANFEIQANEDFFRTTVKQDALKLKEMGADVIVFNIHGGDSDSIESYNVNTIVGELTDNNGDYLIDAIVNGHTHSRQSAVKNRGSNKLPMVQGGSYCDSFGEIILEIDLSNMEVKDASSSVINVSSINSNNKEEKTQNQIDIEYNKIKDIVERTYCYNTSTVSKANLGNLLAKEIRKATSADISIMNTGGIRTTLQSGDVTFSKIYDVYPFENHIVCVRVKGSYLNTWISKQGSYYYMDYSGSFNANTMYNVTTIDYVFDSTYWENTILEYEVVAISTTITPRDYLINDLENRGSENFNVNGEIKVDVKPFGQF